MSLVEGTNDFSIVSKLSAASLGYFFDDFLDEMVDKKKRRAPLINWGYYLRYKSLEMTFEKVVSDLSNREGNFQILSIGAGFDTTFFNVNHKYGSKENYHFFEVDLPSNVQRKTNLIKRSAKCRKYLNRPKFQENGGITSETFTLFACDLAHQSDLKQKLKHFHFDFEAPTLILSECVITYMEERDSTNLITFLASVLKNAAFFVYEQIRPMDAFGKFMVKHFTKIGSPIKGVHKYFDEETQCNRYLDSGWEESQAVTLTQVLKSISHENNKKSEKEIEKIVNLELFDEFEELYLKSSHYLVVSSFNGSLKKLSTRTLSPSVAAPTPKCLVGTIVRIKTSKNQSDFHLRRFGHTTAAFGNKIYCVGGFGATDSSHGRLDQVLVIDTESLEVSVEDESQNFARMYASSACDENNRHIFVVGGRSSPKKCFSDMIAIDCEMHHTQNFTYSVPHPTWRHFTALIGDILMCGGGSRGSGVLDVVNVNTRSRLQSVVSDLFMIRSASAAVWRETETVFVTGGLKDNLELSDKIISIKLVDDEVVVKESSSRILPRFSHTSHIVGDKLLVVGGVGVGDPPPCEVIDLVTGERAVFRLPSEVEGELLMCHNHGSAIINDKELWIVGGGGNCFSFGTHYNEIFKFNISNFLK